jgi:hypothetical protein
MSALAIDKARESKIISLLRLHTQALGLFIKRQSNNKQSSIMKTRSEKFTSHKTAAAFLASQPATTARKKGLHLVTSIEGRLMATIENGRTWGGRKGVKASGGKTIAATAENLAAAKKLNKNADSYFSKA